MQGNYISYLAGDVRIVISKITSSNNEMESYVLLPHVFTMTINYA